MKKLLLTVLSLGLLVGCGQKEEFVETVQAEENEVTIVNSVETEYTMQDVVDYAFYCIDKSYEIYEEIFDVDFSEEKAVICRDVAYDIWNTVDVDGVWVLEGNNEYGGWYLDSFMFNEIVYRVRQARAE
jgi:hypothetical protein